MENKEYTLNDLYNVNVKLDTLKKGDKVKFYLEDEVTSVNTHTGHAHTKGGARIRMTHGKGYATVGENAILFRADVTERASKEPANWPPVPGQVWKDDNNVTYMIIDGGTVKAYTTNDVMVLISDLKEEPGIRLVYGAEA
jgi:hypothetical protein